MLVGRDVEQSASEVTVAGSSCLRLALALASRTWARLLRRPVSEVLPGAAVGTQVDMNDTKYPSHNNPVPI